MSANTITASTGTREFVIVGQDTGAGFTLWDVMPTPTDPTRRATALEEIGVDVADALGDVHLEHATTATGAVNQLLTAKRERYRDDDYTLNKNSNRDALDADPAPQPATGAPEPYGKASTLAATRDATYEVTASSVPGTALFNLQDLPITNLSSDWTRDRVRAGIINSGLDWPDTNVLVKIATDADDVSSVGTSGLDLAIACSVLAAAGQLPAACLAGVGMVGELNLDGSVRVPYGLPSAVRRVTEAGAAAVLVPTAGLQDLKQMDARVIGVGSLNEALAVLTGHWHHPQDCTHCTDGPTAPHQPCTPADECPACQDGSPTPV